MAVSERSISATAVTRPTFGQRVRAILAPVWASKTAMVGLAVVIFWILVAIFAPFITRYDPLYQDYESVNEGPSAKHWLGTDDLGRDLWSRLAFGARTILGLAPICVLCALIVGISLGLISGYFGGVVDEILMLVLNSIMAFPSILLYLIIIAAIGPSALNVILAITLAGTPGIARMVRSLTLDIRTREYVAAAKLRGERPLYIMFCEILPNALSPILVDAMLRVGYAAIAIGTLGFLGLGLPPPSPDWGSMVAYGRRFIWLNPWAVLWPSLAISSLVVGLNLFADGLREKTLAPR